MSDLEVPKLVRNVRGRNRAYYSLEDGDAFPHERWLPTLRGLLAAETIGDQKKAFTVAVANVGGNYGSLPETAKDRFRYMRGIEARFATQGNQIRLLYLAANLGSNALATIGYQDASKAQPYPAFAVVDIRDKAYHGVFRGPDQPLGDIEREISSMAVDELAKHLDAMAPSHAITAALRLEEDL